MPITPLIDASIANLAPNFRALSIVVEAGAVVNPTVADQALAAAYAAIANGEPVWAQAHLEAWAEVFNRFGVKAKRSPCSADALRKRLDKDGTLPRIDPVVDLYNAISVRYALPVGGENLAAYIGQPRLTIATGSEIFDTMKDGQLVEEHPEPGEVIWRDDHGVTCRRWNWRQGVRTRLSSSAKHMWFVLESLSPMPIASLHEAGEELAHGLQAMLSNVRVEKQMISFQELAIVDANFTKLS